MEAESPRRQARPYLFEVSKLSLSGLDANWGRVTSGSGTGRKTPGMRRDLALFGRPKSMNGFSRAQRPIESEVEHPFTISLQYEGALLGLLVTVKTAVTSPTAQQLKQLVRRTKGSFVKIGASAKPIDEGFGVESEALRSILTTYK
ncbi:hypothetical protein Micbo1qcDRAFT_224804 [Microdochium bolleyi]|uniref:Uncharacterized protein n=1 Tax=Microdochium bolleyi TaxID=196109 RepID=A0A136IJF4_9PEZI|nr:hypothetical protein Micbo1qcDRAFT_224804 [Microdochium bolleyi]